MTLHRGTSIPNKKITNLSDVFPTQGSRKLHGTTVMNDLPETLSFQRYADNVNGFSLDEFANQSLTGSDSFAKVPVIMEVKIDSEAVFNKYKKGIWVILQRGSENDLHQPGILTTSSAVPVSAERFSFQEFNQYQGEVLLQKSLVSSNEAIQELGLAYYNLEGKFYSDFVKKYAEGSLQPIVTTESLQNLADTSLEGTLHQFFR